MKERKKEDRMSLSPIANRSFLHGDGKPSPNSEKIVYATLDSLALKRATLPLQLLPVDDRNEPKRKGETCNDTTARRSSFKVDAASSLSSKERAKYVLVLPSPSPEAEPSGSSEQRSVFITDRNTGETKVVCLQRAVDIDNNIDTDPIKNSPDTIADYCEDDTRRRDIQPVSDDSSAEENAIFPNSISESDRLIEQADEDDYERIELIACREANLRDNNEDETTALCSKNVIATSLPTNELTRKSSSETRLDEEKRLIESLTKELLLDNERDVNRGKKKNHFAKNVLHFVPEYLVKGSKRRKKKKSALSSSLNSLKPSTLEKVDVMADDRFRSRSLSREESRCLNISSPTNFVHVASATSPNLILNENTVKFNLEQAVITHEQKCAILPLLVARSEKFFFDASSSLSPGRDNENEETTRRIEESRKRELLSELRARSAKALEPSQQRVKTSENRAYEGNDSFRTNTSFLWSNQSKNLSVLLGRSTLNETLEYVDEDQYDDVGPLNLINQDDDYDDVGLPTTSTDESSTVLEPTRRDSESIYDDVVTLLSPIDDPEVTDSRNVTGNDNTVIQKDQTQENDDYHLFEGNNYSSVDDEETGDDALDNDQDDYDDVGLPGEERVNSLYAGSTAGSILGSTWTNGKESEWEDLEESIFGPARLPKKNSNSSGIASETQVISSKKKLPRRWSRNGRRQRSRLSRRSSSKSSNKSTRDFTSQVAVSLGTGSVLLVGRAEKVEEWKREEPKEGTGQENSWRTQGLVQMRVIDLDEDLDTQETSCYVHEENASDDSTYESLQSFQQDDFSTDSETEKIEERRNEGENVERDKISNRFVIEYSEAPTRPNPPPPREISLTRTLGRRIKMLRRTWSITKGSLGRMRRRTSVDEEHVCEENDQSNLEGGRYFGFARHFKKSVTGFSTFYLNGYTANGPGDSTKIAGDHSSVDEETDHYSVLAEQEPLYQFYAAAAARGAFDSNSDGYEEVEDMIPSQSTTDLAKPGHRTLWCQTVQVVNTGLLQRLTTEERKIQEAKFEILTSEASYLNSLRVLRNEFINEPSINEILTPVERDKLFGGIPSVLHASEQCLAELESIWRQDPMLHGLPDVLLKYAEKCLDIYVAYCSNQVSIDSTLKDLRSRKGLKFLDVVSQVEARSACQSLSLHSFLMLPMQRITRLPLLADAVLSKLSSEHVDRHHWERVLSSLSYVVTECNEGARAAAKEAEMESLARKLEYSAKIKPIVLKGKYLVKTGPVVQLSNKTDAEYKLTFGRRFNKTHLYLLLLTDYLLVAKYKSNHDTTYTVIDTCKRSLIALESVPEDSPFAGRNAMLLTLLENYSGHQIEYILTCESDTERQRWLEAVSPSNRGLVEETLYEVWDCPQVVALYCYSPNQPDELSLHPGDVINVFRKMSDGWYHGEKLLNREQGWFPGNYTKEVASEHVRARNLKQRHRLLALNGNVLQRKTKQ
ncbi:ephexin isoform X2 [Osmia lignaria lignaria]|uniref:ephexin isoform X2 n=1 Tax=Osmia lignaria lignaria TaxID=1437193 RepID=UPI00402B2AA3